ncbi:N-acetylmuramoyl-L-alanine amidase [Lysobacter auxotrophicus]|uniref:N-acetylmuramoyl-L-alanine amidase n=1 Tax=Lysobacter auxotrophicus TaxID=2992573 RepID=A0ABM8DA00_9GAMM|nr:N-acetylmuramoyl-L-alanine amidase [Lysobacter auxotrophicus]BDU15350.1 N-acetylmuramoyl-L-alanine amidase [Lysobacter auxotrophicus]
MRAIALALVLATLAGCATTPPPPREPVVAWRPSLNHDARSAVVIVLHQTEMESAEAALLTLQTRNSGGRVSAHYLIGDDGALFQLVDEGKRAWHAGASRWGGLSDLNSASIGIELDNDGQEPFSDAQIATLLWLLDDITSRLDIPKHLVIGHGDIAPTRKRDPSALFPWKRLADAGYGLWPRAPLAPAPAGFDRWAAMRLVGYDLSDPDAALRAFHRHYRGNEESQWLPGDADILFDLQRQLMGMPEPLPLILPTPTPTP